MGGVECSGQEVGIQKCSVQRWGRNHDCESLQYASVDCESEFVTFVSANKL